MSVLLAPFVSSLPATVRLRPELTAAVAAADPGAPFGNGLPYPGPLPIAIPAAGGVIQAVNFNSGPAEQAFHGCTPGDHGNASWYRTDPHDIDIFSAGASGFYIQSSSPHVSSNPIHNCPASSTFFSDYVKYSFTVAQTGWYTFSAVGQNGGFSTRVDDIEMGQTAAVGAWSNVVLIPAVHLIAAVAHVLTVEFLGFNTDLATVTVTPTTVDFPTPRIVSAPLTTNEVVIADAVATDPQFGAVPNNPAIDNSGPIQQALNVVGMEGGGTVFLPPGLYTVKGPLSVPANVTLRGDWSATTSTPGQTILAATVPAGVSGTPFISLAGTNAGISHLSVWYPNQSFARPTRYPPTIESWAASVNVADLTLFDSDQGVVYEGGSASDITGLHATCFTTCIVDDGDLDYSFITNITISNQIWETAPSAEVTNNPTSAANRAALDTWTAHHLTALHLYRNDNLTMYGVTVTNALHGIVTTATSCHPSCGTYGSFSKISANLNRSGENPVARPAPSVNSIMDTDLVSHAKKIAYRFAPSRMPARTGPSDFYDVMAQPFDAHADGLTDDTTAIQSALNTASRNGGGTVYLPSGTYLVSQHLVVPAGVELRGAYANRHTSETTDSTTLLAVEGQDTPNPNTDPAFISLSPHSGVRGITIRYPNQGFGSTAYPVTPYPYTIRSLGPDTWVQDANVLNGYQIIDLATYRSDGFVVKNLWATAFRTGVTIGGGSKTGWLEQTVISYGDLYESRHDNSPYAYGRNAIVHYTSGHVVAYHLGDTTGLESLGAMSFNVSRHLVTDRAAAGSAGPTNSTFFAPSSDSADSAGFVLSAGTNVNWVGLLARSPYTHDDVQTASSFHGVDSIDDGALAGTKHGNDGIIKRGGTLHLYPENLRSPAVSS
ncbi:MAG: glycosyl hydrolase family 28-related protein [Acidimicrobiia bacterium]